MLIVLLAAAAALPSTPKQPVTAGYHGVKVVDDYSWLENDADPKVKTWSDAQNRVARAFLDKVLGREALQKRLDFLVRAQSESVFGLVDRGGAVMAEKFDPKKKQPFLVRMPDVDHPEAARAVVDPNVMDPSGHTAIDFWVVSLDGKKLAVSLSKNGSEAGDVHVFDAATGGEIDAPIPHVNNGTAGGSVAWNADATGFWYTRYPRGAERKPEDMGFYQQIYYHRLGTPTEQDLYELGKDFPRIAEIVLDATEDGRYVLATVKNGDGGAAAFHVRSAKGWTEISKFEDQLQLGVAGLDGAGYFLSRQGAPRGKIVRVPFDAPSLAGATVVVPEGDGAITGVLPTVKRLYVTDLLGGPTRVRAFPPGGGEPMVVKTPDVASVYEMARLRGDEVVIDVATFVTPPAFFRVAADGSTAPTRLAITSPADFSDCEVVRDFAVSKDGTRVPLNIVRRKGTPLNGRNPTLLSGYGGYGISMTPGFSASRRVWMDAGGIYVLANLRGGGEYGEEWHKAGNLTHKQNVFDDFHAVARYLVEKKYTDRSHLVILGGSNGGLLMGAELTQHPADFKAVVSTVGIYDMLRVESTPNGAFNVTEFGTVKDPEQFKALYAYSPYHHVRKTAYPPVLLVTGANDPRVEPWHSRKMLARLQAANTAGTPILLRTSSTTGHGVGTSIDERIAELTDIYGFFFAALGINCCVEAPPQR